MLIVKLIKKYVYFLLKCLFFYFKIQSRALPLLRERRITHTSVARRRAKLSVNTRARSRYARLARAVQFERDGNTI